MQKKFQNISHRIIAFALAILMIVTIIPLDGIVNAADPNYDYLELKNLKAEYTPGEGTKGEVKVTWDTIDDATSNVKQILIQRAKDAYDPKKLETRTGDNVAKTELINQVNGAAGTMFTYYFITTSADGEATKENKISIVVPYVLETIGTFEPIAMENDVTKEEIISKLPAQVTLTASGTEKKADVTWDTAAIAYDQSKIEAQSVTVNGTFVLPDDVKDYSETELKTSIRFDIAAATKTEIQTDLDATVEKKVEDDHTLEITATGTNLTYAWYKEGETDVKSTTNILELTNLSYADTGVVYYCVVTGKNGSVESTHQTVVVNKHVPTLGFSVTPDPINDGETASPIRPNGKVTITVTDIPTDATGEVEIWVEGEKLGKESIGKHTLSGAVITDEFSAKGQDNIYKFTVEYKGDSKYESRSVELEGYSFKKGEQASTVQLKPLEKTTYTYEDNLSFSVEGTGGDTGKFEYQIVNEQRVDDPVEGAKDVPGEVAKFNSETGKVEIIGAGTFQVGVKSLEDDDYNETAFFTDAQVITIERAPQTIAFSAGETTKEYFPNFYYQRKVTDEGIGTGDITYEIVKTGSENEAKALYMLDAKEGKFEFKDAEDDLDSSVSFDGKAGIVTVKATKAQDNRYAAAEATYEITITKAKQEVTGQEFKFASESQTITYTPDLAKQFFPISEDGYVTEGNATQFRVIEALILPEDRAEGVVESLPISDVVQQDLVVDKDYSLTSDIRAKRSGVITLQATLPGNGVYEDAVAKIEIRINRAKQEDYSEFAFEVDNNPIVYNHAFSYIRKIDEDKAGIGTGEITYSLDNLGDQENIAKGLVIPNKKVGEIKYENPEEDNKPDFSGSAGRFSVTATKAQDACYLQTETFYEAEILKGDQLATGQSFEFADGESLAITYVEGGIERVISISSDDTKDGWVKNQPMYRVIKEEKHPEDTREGEVVSGVVTYESIDDDGYSLSPKATGKRWGVVTIEALLVGNDVYNDVKETFTLQVNRGEIATAEGGSTDSTKFHFELSDEDAKVKYGYVGLANEGFANLASGGQTDSMNDAMNGDKTTIEHYVVEDNGCLECQEKCGHLSIAVDKDNGIISFPKEPWEVAEEFTATVKASYSGNDQYNPKDIMYTLTVDRDEVTDVDFFVENGENKETIKPSSNLELTSNWYNATYPNITLIPNEDNEYVEIGELVKVGENQFELEWKPIVKEDDGRYNIDFYLKAKDGSITKLANRTVNYDKTVANAKLTLDEGVEGHFWTKFLDAITFGSDMWKNTDQDILVNATDEVEGIASGVALVEYYEQNTDFAKYDTEGKFDCTKLIAEGDDIWKEVPSDDDNGDYIPVALEDQQNKKVVVYVRVTDIAGNVTYYRSNGIGYDNVTPEVATPVVPEPIVSIKFPEKKGLYNGDVPFELAITEPTTSEVEGVEGKEVASGIKEVTVTIKGTDAEEYTKVIKVNALASEIHSFDSAQVDSEEYEVDNTFVVPKNFDSNHLTIDVEVVDYAGNVYPSTKRVDLAVDKTRPEIKVSYNDKADTFSSEKYIGNNKNRIATIDITELNFDNKAVQITVKRDGQLLNVKPAFRAIAGAVDENGDQIGWRMKIDYAKYGDGDYEFDIAYTDKALNKNKAVDYGSYANPKKFTIDNTKPTIEVAYDNNSAMNGNYYKADRVATITIDEHNFDASRVKIIGTATDDGKAVTFPVESKWTSKGDTHTAKISYTADAKYSFDIEMTDKADNKSANYKVDEFFVDKTNPALTITGVVDKSANNDKGNIGFVITATDTNFDGFTPVLTGVVMTKNGLETKTFDIGRTNDIKNGQTYTVDNIPTDGVYSITCTLVDKAGNAYVETSLQDKNGKTYVTDRAGDNVLLEFSVNRDGSTFKIEDGTYDMLANFYLQNVTEDVKIIEINADKIKSSSVTLNGEKLTEDTDYTVELELSTGGWHNYTYTLKKELFEGEGEYNIVVSSKDEAGNKAFSDIKEASMKFVVDRTAPVVNVIGMTDNGRYQTNVQTVTIIPTDDGGALKSLLVCTVDKDGSVIDEFYNLSDDALKEAMEQNGGKFTIDLKDEGILYQNVKIVCTDYATAGAGEDAEATNKYEYTYTDVTVTASGFLIFWANKAARYGTIAGLVVVIAAIIFFIVYKRRKKEDEK